MSMVSIDVEGTLHLIINHLLRAITLLQERKEFDDIRVLQRSSTECTMLDWLIRQLTSVSNWSPVPSKQSTSVRAGFTAAALVF